MTKQFSLLLTTAIASSLVLVGCGKAPINSTAAQMMQTRATAQAVTPATGGHLVITSFSAPVEGKEGGGRQHQVFRLAGKCDGAPFTLSISTFFPYYVPMFGDATVNGKTEKLTPADARALAALIKNADGFSQVKPYLGELVIGLDFLGSHPDFNTTK